jgi:dienelactone hydrolase
MSKLLIACLPLLVAPLGSLVAEETIFDVPALTATPLNAKTLNVVERDGIVTEEVWFHSETDGDKAVEIFAYFSFPKGARKLPAFIWNPGGLGQASPAFTEIPARRGYAVLCIDFPQPGYRSTGNYAINTGLALGADPKQAPIYHGAVALLKAVSYLSSRDEVYSERIGMAGSSWGGFFTTLMVGIDPRLKAGSSLYGTGSLQLGNAWWDGASQNGRMPPTAQQRDRWRTTLDPAWRLPTKKTPIAWFTGTNDKFYLLPDVMKSYEMAAGVKHLCMVPNWDHALPSEYPDEQVYAWLDVHLRDQPPFPEVSPVVVTNESGRLLAAWRFKGEAVAADLIASYGDAGNWQGRYWHTFKAAITDHACRVALPDCSLPCYVSGSVVAASGIRSSTPLVRIDSTELGITPTASVPDYDGCSEWGGFEEAQVAFLVRHDRSGQARWIPRLSADAKEGKHAAVLNPDRTVLPPILSTATVSHCFSCFMKADKRARVDVRLADEQKEFAIDTEWTEIEMNLTPINTLMGGIPATITAPPGATVLVDMISFRPINSRNN